MKDEPDAGLTVEGRGKRPTTRKPLPTAARPGRVVAPALPEPGTVIQIAAPHNWAACFATIIEAGDFGVIAAVAVPHTRRPFANLPESMRASLGPQRVEIKLAWDEFEPLFVAAPYQLPPE